MKHNSICHVEWQVSDLGRAKNFLSGLFGWKFEDWGPGGYSMFDAPEGPGGGIEKVDKVAPGKSPVVYVLVDAIEPYIEKVKSLGGSVAKGKSEIPNIGWFALVNDHDENVIGLFESLKKS